MLTPEQQAVLDLENQHWGHAGNKDNAIVTQLGILPARYWQIVDALTDRDDAMAYAPLLIGRLRRLRDARRAARTGAR